MRACIIERLPIVGVLGSGEEPHEERAGRVGRWLAGLGVHLLTGGGGGVMESVSRTFCSGQGRKGVVIGIIPGAAAGRNYSPASGYPNPWVEVPVYTHFPLSGERGTEPMSRNHINVLSSDVIIALPGSRGTAGEVELALRYNRPLIAYISSRDEIEGFPVGAPAEADFGKVQEFVLSVIGK